MTLSIAQAITQSRRLEASSDTAKLDAEVLLAHVLGKDRSYLYTWPERRLSDAQQSEFERLLQQREAGVPIAYLLGYKEFWSLSLAVNQSTLIPRPETELLVEIALRLLPRDQAIKALDLGAGSGAIALAIAHERPRWNVTASDVSPAALDMVEANKIALGVANLRVLESDWFARLGGESYHLIVSNPPYVDASDPLLGQGDLRYEPRSALVAAERGVADLKWLIEGAPEHLIAGGWLLLEHGFNQATLVASLMRARGFAEVATEKDLAGHERATFGRIQ